MRLSRRRRIRFLIAGAGLLAVSAGLFGFAFRDGIQFFRTPSEVLARPPGAGETFRIGGMVEAGSLVREGTRLSFRVGDGSTTVAVVYSGITPDLFAEGAGVVATGRLVEGRFEAHEILAKHDEEYVPRELAGMTGH
ncbi:MAG: cytochrome c maturation protein CcmE [Rhodobacteraceae bacterium]|nr:cytochrome c maturation protein CcmE [Paracoccaceae bacterium]